MLESMAFLAQTCQTQKNYKRIFMSNNNKQSERHSNTYKKADKEFYDKLRKEIEESWRK